jgi:hypothetical protein
MKLLGFHNDNQIVASIARHDYVSLPDGTFADGGQPGIGDSMGYNRHYGKAAWFKVPQTYAELYNDYQYNFKARKYGIWNLADVKILSPEEIPDTDSFEWRVENAIWGTNGPKGDQPTRYVLLKDCELDHLQKISDLLELRGNKSLKKIVDFWIDKKKSGA